MFDGMLKSKFHTKCKSLIKHMKTRLDMIQKKRNAMQKFLKNDIADLLKTGLDINAYGRAEGFLVELNLSSCYEFIGQYCGCIADNISVMSKQKECPEDCKGAVSSLMFAAARFADLPELRELRKLFTERYGNSIESYVNREFVEMLKSAPPTKDMKLQLLQDIALESGIEWSSKGLEQKLYKPSAPEQDAAKNYQLPRNWKLDTQGRMQDISSNKKGEVTHDGYQLYRSMKSPSNDDIQAGKIDQGGLQNSLKSVRSPSKEEVDDGKRHLSYKSIPPPYTRPKVSKYDSSLNVPPIGSDGEEIGPIKSNADPQDELVGEAKSKPRSVRSRPLKSPPAGNKNNIGKQQVDGRSYSDEEERAMDRLLIHNSKKQSSSEPGKAEPKHRGKEGLQSRSTSLPLEPTSPTEAAKGHLRAASFQPNMFSNTGNVLDYDDFVARLAALKGEGRK